ncbi:MAG TPA: ferrous iron transport protein B [Nitrospirae bacterium]|nr:ferrous iron transport protein B [bacterium BMS3Abin06]HDH11644.1 ferrous iron transport protein B [Nitrospirota bacterium]HDZ02064.1 ferrous iron transport protein B [Nitrospirota bacterium]
MALLSLGKKEESCRCHGNTGEKTEGLQKVVLVGSPNVGKSVVFGYLTGRYVTVSNYPGTTVDVTRGKGKLGDKEFEIIDTPGMYSLLPITEEERVARSILLDENPAVVVQVVDAKNIERMLHMTLQLMEAEAPLVLVLNLMDEAERLGMKVDTGQLERELGIPVVATVATEGRGMDLLKEAVIRHEKKRGGIVKYDKVLESAVQRIQEKLKGEYRISKRAIALFLLQDDPDIRSLVRKQMKEDYRSLEEIIGETKNRYGQPLNYIVTLARQREILEIIKKVTVSSPEETMDFRERLSRLMMHPLAGVPILLLIIYSFYEFVGVFGAQISVNFLEETVFGKYINPFVTGIVISIIPWKVWQNLFVHDYGIITLGIRYAIAIILPVVTTFFIAFSIIEDSGYLPRLAMFIDRLFKKIGLNGRAVIPIVLGFGCDTMATMVTRTLETKRERIIATFLLALAVPCSAQIGVILALLAGNVGALWIFISVMAMIFLFTGYLAAKIVPGEKPLFFMEVPPLRWPKLSNVFTKTYTRVEWYFKEVLPLFVLASILIWAGKLTGLFDLLTNALSYPAALIGLPKEAATAFLYGFFRRDFGAAGLYDLKTAGLLNGIPLVVSVVTLALFMPCIAQFSITIKERGWKMALGMAAFIFPFAFFVGYLLNFVLNGLGIAL